MKSIQEVPLLFLVFFFANSEGKAFPVYDILGQLVEQHVNFHIIAIRSGIVDLHGAYGN